MAQTSPLGASSCPTCGAVYDYSVQVCPKDGTSLTGWRAPITGEHDPVIGLTLGDYVVQKRVAHGGMGIVYLAAHPEIGRQVAVKVLRPELAENQSQKDRFVAEAKAISAIRHRGIVDVISFGRLPDERNYMVMEYLDGEGLDALLAREGQLSYGMALPLFDEMLDALGAAHTVGVIHRDMKPSNVFLTKQSNGTRLVKLVDFGLAKQTPLGDVHAQAYARASLVAGTPEYISPEQIRGEASSPRTDLYGFAVVAFEVLTGKLPFVGQTVVDTLEMHARRVPPHVKVFRGDVPAPLDDLIFRMMSKRPEDRPSSAEAARQELQRLMREMNIDTSLQPRDAPTSPSLPEIPGLTGVPLPPRGESRQPLWIGLGVLGVAAIAVGAFFMGRVPVAVAPRPVAAAPAPPPPAVAPAVATVDPPPPPVPEPEVAAAAPEVAAPEPELEPDPPSQKRVKTRPFAETEALTDDAWRAKMKKRMKARWKRYEARSADANSDTSAARVFFEKYMGFIDAAKGLPARRKVNAQISSFERDVLKL